MSLRRCIPEMLGDGRINEEQAGRMRSLFEELEGDLSTKFGRETAEAMASEEAIRRFESEAIHKRHQAALQIKAQQRIMADVRSFRGDSPSAAAVALFTHDSRAPYANVERRADMIEGQAHAMMAGLLERFSRNVGGQIRDRATLMNVVREAFGESTGDLAAKELAQAWTITADMLRNRFNAAGGGIGKLENWGMPQVHNMMAVRSAPFEEWRDFIAPLLDRQRMKDAGGNVMTPQQLELALRDTYETIRTDGWADRTAGSFAGAGKLANRRADHRFLMFKDADSWLAYSRRFGRPTSAMAEAIDPDGPIFDAMIGHIRGMASDIALTETLGPNPAATVRWIKDGLMMEATGPSHAGGKRIKQAQKGIGQVDALYGEVSGINNKIANETLANVASAVRSWQVASKLGSATLSAISDVGFQHVTARFNGLNTAQIVANYGKLLNPASRTDRRLAQRLWMVNETATRMATAQSRLSGEVVTGEMSKRLAEGVMRLSGLNAWTQAGRWAFGMEFWSHITDQAPKNWNNINKPFRKQLERYGFTARDWDSIRSTQLEETDAGQWLLPDNIADPSLAERLAMMIATETDYAVPTASIRVTSAVNATFRKGTWLGELGRSVLLFKSFPITVLWMHGRRMVEQEAYNGLKYAASLTIATTIMGAMATQLRNVASGKDVQDPTEDPLQFWGKAFAQGGGAGLMGDFISNQTNRYEQSIAEWAAGPVFSTGQDLTRLAKAGVQEAGDSGEHTGKSARALRRVIQGNTPGSSLWYLKLAFQREVLDQMQEQMDPDYWDSFDRMEKRAQEDGAGFWWRPGETAPDRAPAVSASP